MSQTAHFPCRTTAVQRSFALLSGIFTALLLGSCGGGDTAVKTSPLALAVKGVDACSAFGGTPTYNPQVRSPLAVLGFDLGSREVTHAQAGEFMAALAVDSRRVFVGTAGNSVADKPLYYAIVGKESQVSAPGLEDLSRAIRQLMDPETTLAQGQALAASLPAVLWLGGNVHGNEESGADASLRVLYELAAREDCAAQRIRDNSVVVVLPIQNPDGRAAGTRRNAFGFDLNRDWFARTQPETDGKLELMRQYPPQLFIDAHEMGSKNFFFPPTADPTYHEVPDVTQSWVNRLFSPAISAEFDRQKIPYFHGAPYDLYAIEYGDSVSTVGFHAAGMTFEKHSGSTITQRTREHYLAMWASLYAGASDKQRLLTEWHQSQVAARDQGSQGVLEPNGLYFDGKRLYQQVANLQVRHYFFPADPTRARELAQLVRRLQRMDVKVMQLSAPLTVPDFRPYGGAQGAVTLPAGSYWVPMNQARKHWIQAMLHEQPYSPLSVSYDVSAWSNPLLLNVAGGSSAAALSPEAKVAAPVPELAPQGAPSGALRIGLFEMPGSTSSSESAGSVRHLFERVWGVAYTPVTVADIVSGLPGIDVLLVPDGYVNGGLQALGNKGQKALAAWVEAGGRYVGYLGGTELAVGVGISTAVLKQSHTAAPGALIRVRMDPASPLAAGMTNPWVMYVNDAVMEPGLGKVVARFPAVGDPDYHTSGLAIGVDELANTAALVDEAVGSGRSVVFSFDPNFRGWTEGTQRLLWNVLYGPNPTVSVSVSVSSKERASALDIATRALKSLPDTGKAIRIVVSPADADLTRAMLQRYGAEFKESTKKERTVFVIANREGLSGEEHPFAADLARELAQQITPLSIYLP
ncbi:M14 family zinc carboxypeptidase [Acidovorax carolinensis]|nr:M14 family zinc carboxypeptidase [Acidovorax carolinensis]